jgi:hypothetical protein
MDTFSFDQLNNLFRLVILITTPPNPIIFELAYKQPRYPFKIQGLLSTKYRANGVLSTRNSADATCRFEGIL